MTRSRRSFLRHLSGGALALPFLGRSGSRAQASIPTRTIFIYTPHNSMPTMIPSLDASGLNLRGTYLEAFQPYADRALFVDGLEGIGGHGAGRGEAFAGRPASDGSNLPTGGPTIDIALAAEDQRAGVITPIPTINFRGAGKNYGLDNGNGISRDFDNRGITPLLVPEIAFDRIYGGVDSSPEEIDHRALARTSLLDGVMEDYRALQGRLGARDRGLLDRHLEAIRQREMALTLPPPNTCSVPGRPAPSSRSDVRRTDVNHAKMCALAAGAILCGTTNHIIFENYGHDAYVDFTFLDGVTSTDYHNINHGATERAVEQHFAINAFFAQNIAEHLVRPLVEAREADGSSVLDHTMIVWVTELGMSESYPHGHMRGDTDEAKRRNVRVPAFILGGGATPKNTMVNADYRSYHDFLLTLIHAAGHTHVASFGDSGNAPIEPLLA
ncbi:MAG: DUF1552 domain-containing protein [Myxococcota bacterium]